MRKSKAVMIEADKETLACIADFQKAHGYSPTYEEIAGCLGLSGKSAVQRRVARLVAAGLIVQEARSRAIRIVKGK